MNASKFCFMVIFCLLLANVAMWGVSYSAKQPVARAKQYVSKNGPTLRFEQKTLPQGTLYTLTVPAKSQFRVFPTLSETLEKIDSPVWASKGAKPVFLINAGFFDPNNSLTTSFVMENGSITGDPRKNPHLTKNENIQKYLPQIFNRTEFRVYLCRDHAGQFETRYDIAPHNAANPPSCLLKDAVGAGPQLTPTLTDVLEGFVDFNSAGKIIRDPVGVGAKNARSVVGIKENGDVIIAMGAQNPAKPLQTGFSLTDMAILLKQRGVTKAMALDGGSSSGFIYEGKPHYGKFTKDGLPVKRPVKSVLIVAPISK